MGDDEAKSLTLATMNEHLRSMQYAVRGEVPMRAAVLEQELRERPGEFPFDHVLYCNIGNPQAVGQQPLTFVRQVLALVDSPGLLRGDAAALRALFDPEEVERAEEILATVPGGLGAYTDSQGLLSVRENVARFIEARDECPSHADDVFLGNGASSAIQMLLNALIADPAHGVMIPVPQYPIYSALVSLLNGRMAGYYLDEDRQWALDEAELERSFAEAERAGVQPRALVVINPGNPTGNTLSYDDIASVIRFCHRKRLVLLADEVYQENVYHPELRPFVSCKKVMHDMGLHVELASFHSTSKGFLGECGRRGGYMEMCNFDPDVKAQIIKLASSGLCSNTDGQVMTDLMVRPPSGSARPRYEAERDAVLHALAAKARMLWEFLNEIPGISCQPLEGAMYAFPKIELPARYVEEARAKGVEPDAAYALSLLEHTGICTVPGSGFKQKEGTFHLRMTFLPDMVELEAALERFREHHLDVICGNNE